MMEVQGSKDSREINNRNQHKSTAIVLFLGISVFALGQGLEFGNGFNNTPGFIGLTISIYFLLAGLLLPKKSPFPNISEKLVFTILMLALGCQIIELFIVIPSLPTPRDLLANLWQFRILISLGGICALVSLIVPDGFNGWLKKITIGLTLFFVFTAGAWIIQKTPNPGIDVYLYQQSSSRALLKLQNPYEVNDIPNIYPDTSFYGAHVVKNGILTIGNPYPPLSIYFSLIGYAVAGDIRYSYLLAILISTLLLFSFNKDRIGLLIAYVYLFTPRVFYVVEESWTEPFVVMVVLIVVWCAIHKPSWTFIALGLLLASKQYMLFLLPIFGFLFPPGSNLKTRIKASFATIGVAFLVTAPLAFWNFNAFVWNVGMAQWDQPFRVDSLSYAALLADVFGKSRGSYVSFIALCAAILISYRYLKPSPKSFALALAFSFMLFIAFNKQAFCNYYFLIIGLLSTALALSHRAVKIADPVQISP